MRVPVILLLMILSGCDYYDNRLHVINYTNGQITVETCLDTIPDFPSINKTEFYLREAIVSKDTFELTAIGKNGWPFLIARSKNKKLNLVVYNIDSLRKYKSIDTLISHHIYTRYEFSEDEMKDKDWKVVIK